MASISYPAPEMRIDVFFEQHRPQVTACVNATLKKQWFSEDLIKLIVDFMISQENPFGTEEYKKYLKVFSVSRVPELPVNEFYRFWNSPDPMDPTKHVYDTHFPPVFFPANVTFQQDDGTLLQINIRNRVLGKHRPSQQEE